MTRVTIGLTLLGLLVLFIAYAKGVGAIHGGDVIGHMYWATAAITLVALASAKRCSGFGSDLGSAFGSGSTTATSRHSWR